MVLIGCLKQCIWKTCLLHLLITTYGIMECGSIFLSKNKTKHGLAAAVKW